MAHDHAHAQGHAPAHTHASHGAGHISPISLYITIFLALMVLTAVTVGAAYIDLGQFNFTVAMIIALFKASLVVWYFMHVKYQSHLTKLAIATGLFFLVILLGETMVDYASRAFTPMLPPTTPDSVIGPPAVHTPATTPPAH